MSHAGDRTGGMQAPDGVRGLLLEALRRRCDRAAGPVRALLDARIAALEQAADAASAEAGTPPGLAALAALVAGLRARQAPASPDHDVAGDAAAAPASDPAAAPPAPPLLREARAMWQTVRTRSQLRRARSQPLEHAGPLNSAKLAGRALDTIGNIAPGYLEYFVAYLDVLAGLEALLGAAPAAEPASPARRPPRPRTPRRKTARRNETGA